MAFMRKLHLFCWKTWLGTSVIIDYAEGSCRSNRLGSAVGSHGAYVPCGAGDVGAMVVCLEVRTGVGCSGVGTKFVTIRSGSTGEDVFSSENVVGEWASWTGGQK